MLVQKFFRNLKAEVSERVTARLEISNGPDGATVDDEFGTVNRRSAR